MPQFSEIAVRRRQGTPSLKTWGPALAAGLFAVIWVLLWLAAPVDGCYTDEQSVPKYALNGPIAVAILAAGFLAWRAHRSVRAIVAHVVIATLVALPLAFLSAFAWVVVNQCPLSTR